jgi:hypothetical protein
MAMNHVAPPVTLMLIPHPVNLIVTANTFIRFLSDHGREDIGLVVIVDPVRSLVTVRLFLTWTTLSERIGEQRLGGVSLWPKRFSSKPPTFLCDSDVEVVVPTSNVLGLAFVLYEDEPVLRQLEGMQHMYVVSSFYSSLNNSVHHFRSFQSFPSTQHPTLMSTCFPSSIFKQILRLKSKMQQALNTRSVRSSNSVVISVENFSISTWEYMTKDLSTRGIVILTSSVVLKSSFMESDTFVVQKYRGEVLSFNLALPNHLNIAQSLFGTTFGVGVRFIVPCSVRGAANGASVENSRAIHYGDVINVIPFSLNDGHNYSVHRGVFFRYIPMTSTLSVTVRFIRVHRRDEMQMYLRQRDISVAEDDAVADDDINDNAFPLHSDVEVYNKKIKSVCFDTSTVTLSDDSTLGIAEVIQYYNNLI